MIAELNGRRIDGNAQFDAELAIPFGPCFHRFFQHPAAQFGN
jgi:hypothetical protein